MDTDCGGGRRRVCCRWAGGRRRSGDGASERGEKEGLEADEKKRDRRAKAAKLRGTWPRGESVPVLEKEINLH